MPSKIKNQEDDFYGELDKKTVRHSCCTFQTMMILFGVMILVAIFGTIYVAHQIKQINFSLPSFNLSESLKERLAGKLNPENKSNSQLDIVISSEELSAIVSPGVKTNILEIQESQAKIYEAEIKIFGKLIKPFRSDMEITALPEVEDGKIKFEIEKINAGKLPLPGIINSEIEKGINNLLDENFESIYQSYEIIDVKLRSDELEIIGQLK